MHGVWLGSSGTVTWTIEGLGKVLVIMWSAPYSFDFHTNWLAIGVMDEANLHLLHENTFNEMYKDPESWFKRKEFYRYVFLINHIRQELVLISEYPPADSFAK